MKLSDVWPPDPPLHNLLMPHCGGCPPNCPHRKWSEKYLPRASTDVDDGPPPAELSDEL